MEVQNGISLLLVIASAIGLGWTMKSTLTQQRIKCAWNKCKFNADGECRCAEVKMDSVQMDDHWTVLNCSSYRANVVRINERR